MENDAPVVAASTETITENAAENAAENNQDATPQETVYVKPKNKWTKKKIAWRTFLYFWMSVLALLFLFPVWWMVVNSMKTNVELTEQLSSMRTFLPGGITEWFASYKNLFTSVAFADPNTGGSLMGRAILNSILYCGITVAGVLLVNSLAAYALSRIKFPGAGVITTIVLLLILVPVETSIVPQIVILTKLGLMYPDTRVIGYLIPGLVSPFYIFMFRSYFVGIPKEIEEAAEIDGAGKFRTFFVMIMPLSKAIFATVAIFTFMGAWNDYVFAQYIFQSSIDLMPLQAFLQQVNKAQPKDTAMVMAALTISTIPIAIVYIFCQRYIVEGVSFSGLK